MAAVRRARLRAKTSERMKREKERRGEIAVRPNRSNVRDPRARSRRADFVAIEMDGRFDLGKKERMEREGHLDQERVRTLTPSLTLTLKLIDHAHTREWTNRDPGDRRAQGGVLPHINSRDSGCSIGQCPLIQSGQGAWHGSWHGGEALNLGHGMLLPTPLPDPRQGAQRPDVARALRK